MLKLHTVHREKKTIILCNVKLIQINMRNEIAHGSVPRINHL